MEYYLAADGNDRNDGETRKTAWATWKHAWPYLVAGDMLTVHDGIEIHVPQPGAITLVIQPSGELPECSVSQTGKHVASYGTAEKKMKRCIYCDELYQGS